MKLAEALLLRADLQKRLVSLRDRIKQNVAVQEGEKPTEDPVALLEEASASVARIRSLIFAINRANLSGKTRTGRTLTEALADRDSLEMHHGIVNAAASAALEPQQRYSNSEIRWVKAVDVASLRKDIESLAKSIREVNAEIQEANWQIEIDDI